MRIAAFAVLLAGCVGSHPSDRPLVTDCTTALSSGQHGDPCELVGECGTSSDDGTSRRAALCDSGVLLLSRIEERSEDGVGPCAGVESVEADAFVSFLASGEACVEVTFCNDVLGGGAARRIAQVCQVGASSPTLAGPPLDACIRALETGTDGDPCMGGFACIGDRAIAMGDILPVLAWCDGAILRLAPSQTLIHGGP